MSKDTNGVSRRDFHPEKGKTPGYFCPEGEKYQIPGIGYWYKVCLQVYTFWLCGEVAESEHVKNMELSCRATPVQAASSMSLYTLPKKKKTLRKSQTIQDSTKKTQSEPYGRGGSSWLHFPSDKEGIESWRKGEKNPTFRLMKLLSGGNDPKSQGFIPGSDWDVICHMISIFHIYKSSAGCQSLEKGERKKGHMLKWI